MTFRRWAVLAALALGYVAIRPWADMPSVQGATFFRAGFEHLDESGPNLYNFANRYVQSATTWTTDHRPTGGWKGSGAAHVLVKGCTPAAGRTCTTSANQFNIGWVTPAIGAKGNTLFVRFRIKFDPDTHFGLTGDGQQFGAKFLLQGTRGNDRWIYHLYPPYENNGCTLGFESYDAMGWTPPSSQWHRARDWGLKGEWRDPANANLYAGFTPNVNISWSCAPAVLVTRSNHPSPLKPQRNGAAAADGWTHLQLQVMAGATPSFRQWANTNDFGNPSAERLNMPERLEVTALSSAVYVAGYWGMAQPTDIGFTIDDFEVGPAFDPTWYPGGSGVSAHALPSASPVRLATTGR